MTTRPNNTGSCTPKLFIKNDIENVIHDEIEDVIITSGSKSRNSTYVDTNINIIDTIDTIDTNRVSDEFTSLDNIHMNNILFNKKFEKYKSGLKCDVPTAIVVFVFSVIIVSVIYIVVIETT